MTEDAAARPKEDDTDRDIDDRDDDGNDIAVLPPPGRKKLR